MATLTFLSADGGESPFELSGELSVGREVGNDVVLPEGGLSRKHCRFYEEGGQVFVEDLGSSNGTFVDGERIAEPTSVSEGQEILVANIRVELTAAAARAGTPKRQSSSVRRAAASSGRTGQMAAVPRRGASQPGRRPSSAPRGASQRGGGALEVSGADAAVPAGSARAVLKGMTGPWAGKRFPLSSITSVVGRVEGNEVVVDDDSVSRRHAEVRKSGPGYVVRDLNSANGTYVNGERITEAPLRPGDVLKFGVVEFSYSGPSLSKMAPGPGAEDAAARKKKLLIIGGVVVGVLFLGGVLHMALAPPAIPIAVQAQNDAQGQPPAVPNTQALMGMCRSFSDTDGNTLDWTRAIDACGKVLKADPINADARALKRKSEEESAQKKIYDHAHELYSLGQEELALDEFDKMDTASFYFAQARGDFRKAAATVKKRDGDLCYKEERVGQHAKAWIDCKKYEDFACYIKAETKYQSVFLRLEKRLGKKDPWTCPAKYKRWIGNIEEGIAVDKRLEAIKVKYPDEGLADAIALFAKDPVAGRNALIKYRDRGKDAAHANNLLQYEDAFYSKHQAAYEKMLRNDLDGAGEDILREIEADKALMPDGYEADMASADRDAIANKYADQGRVLLNQQRRDKAYEECVKGYKFTKANLNVSGCLAELETYAAGLDGNCENMSLAMKITRPDSVVHKGAANFVKKNCGN